MMHKTLGSIPSIRCGGEREKRRGEKRGEEKAY
jgi:hypothetical protein